MSKFIFLATSWKGEENRLTAWLMLDSKDSCCEGSSKLQLTHSWAD